MSRGNRGRRGKTVPLELARLQVDAYRYAFKEAVRRANEAIRQRDFFREQALDARCELARATGTCPDESPVCPHALGGECRKRGELDEKARYMR